MTEPTPTPTEAQLLRHDVAHPDHAYQPVFRSKGQEGVLVVCVYCMSYAAQISRHHERHPDHDALWEHTSTGRRQCGICTWQQGRRLQGVSDDPSLYAPRQQPTAIAPQPVQEPAPVVRRLTDSPSVVRAGSSIGVTAGHLLDALRHHHPDDRVEVQVEARRGQAGHRIRRAVVLPSVAREQASA